jgi:diguanylate cyclase (GGDEF)-like protein
VAWTQGSTYLDISNLAVTLIVVAIFQAIQLIEGFWLTPRIMGHRLNLHPGLVLIAIVGTLFTLGALIALIIVPLLGSLDLLFRYARRKRAGIDPWVFQDSAQSQEIEGEKMNDNHLTSTLLLLVENNIYQQQLTHLLSAKYDLITWQGAESLDQPFELCIIDAMMLTNLHLQILARKREDAPYLPFLLVTSQKDLPGLAWHIKYTVDEILLTPIDDLILQPRVETLLHTRQLVQEIRLLADFDELTGVLTRRRLLLQAKREFVRARRFGRPLSVVMLDIDFFKKVNDQHGHAIGDQVLRETAQRCQENIREVDIIGRYGGEEFTIILPELDIGEAQDVAERLRQAIAQHPIETDVGIIFITISLGVAHLIPEDANFEAVIKRADDALNTAKRSGRNQVTKI